MHVSKAGICRQWEAAVWRLSLCLRTLVVCAVEMFAPVEVLAQHQEQQIPQCERTGINWDRAVHSFLHVLILQCQLMYYPTWHCAVQVLQTGGVRTAGEKSHSNDGDFCERC